MEQFDWYDDELRLEDLCSDPFNGEYPDPRIDLRDVHVETMSEYDIMKKVVMPFMMLPQTAEETRKLYEDIIAMGHDRITDQDTMMHHFNDEKMAVVRELRRLRRAMGWIDANMSKVYSTGRFSRRELHERLWTIFCDTETQVDSADESYMRNKSVGMPLGATFRI